MTFAAHNMNFSMYLVQNFTASKIYIILFKVNEFRWNNGLKIIWNSNFETETYIQ